MACDIPDVLEVNGPHPDYPSSHTDFDGVNVNVNGYVACDIPDVLEVNGPHPDYSSSHTDFDGVNVNVTRQRHASTSTSIDTSIET